jgi:hypothetical protein
MLSLLGGGDGVVPSCLSVRSRALKERTGGPVHSIVRMPPLRVNAIL